MKSLPPGVHQERYDNPDFTPDYLRGTLTFTSALPLIHTGSVAKRSMYAVRFPLSAT